MNDPSNDRLLASAANYLIQGQENDAAIALLLCDIKTQRGDWDSVLVYLTGPRQVYDMLIQHEHPIRKAIAKAFDAVIPSESGLGELYASAQLVDNLDTNWREELLEIAEGRGVHNQGIEIPDRKIVVWRNLRFRSETERRIAIALDATGVLFLPNCLTRLTNGSDRVTKEADFLITAEGKWGILEVDGPFHPRAAIDHERDRLFRQYHIRVIERFDWQTCYNNAPQVVREFLALLAKNG